MNFNSHAHVERDKKINLLPAYPFHFNSHAHVERDIHHSLSRICYKKFQLTRSRGAWHTAKWVFKMRMTFQLTRSRGAWHAKREQLRIIIDISTHTLTWSVTGNGYSRRLWLQFQLTRSRGAWRWKWLFQTIMFVFQLTRSRGAWRYDITYKHNEEGISTHTLTWSVTTDLIARLDYFQISTHTLTWSVTFYFLW